MRAEVRFHWMTSFTSGGLLCFRYVIRMHASGQSPDDVLSIAGACMGSLKAITCSAFADHGELLTGTGGDNPEEVWEAFQNPPKRAENEESQENEV